MLREATRTSRATGAVFYVYEYDLDSTRGHKRIFDAVTIFKSKLYIMNATFTCDAVSAQWRTAGRLDRRARAAVDCKPMNKVCGGTNLLSLTP